MQVGLSKSWEVEVDNDIDGRNIDSASEEIAANKAARLSALKVVEYLVSLALLHLRVDIETRVAELRDLLRE